MKSKGKIIAFACFVVIPLLLIIGAMWRAEADRRKKENLYKQAQQEVVSWLNTNMPSASLASSVQFLEDRSRMGNGTGAYYCYEAVEGKLRNGNNIFPFLFLLPEKEMYTAEFGRTFQNDMREWFNKNAFSAPADEGPDLTVADGNYTAKLAGGRTWENKKGKTYAAEPQLENMHPAGLKEEEIAEWIANCPPGCFKIKETIVADVASIDELEIRTTDSVSDGASVSLVWMYCNLAEGSSIAVFNRDRTEYFNVCKSDNHNDYGKFYVRFYKLTETSDTEDIYTCEKEEVYTLDESGYRLMSEESKPDNLYRTTRWKKQTR